MQHGTLPAIALAVLSLVLPAGAEEPSRPVAEVAHALTSAGQAERREAAWELWCRRSEAGPVSESLASALRDTDAYVRDTCVCTLRGLIVDHPEAIPQVVTALRDERTEVRRGASDLLPWAYGRVVAARDALIEALEDDDAQVRVNAARSLAKLPRESAAPAHRSLLARVTDAVAAVRAAALAALVETEAPEAPETAVAALDDEDEGVRMHALRLLRGIPGTPAAPVETVCRLACDESPDVRRRAAFLLGRYVDDTGDAIPTLLRVFADESEPVRLAATVSLAALARVDARALPPLSEALWENSSWAVRQGAVGLGAAGGDAAPYVPDLCHVLRSKDDDPARFAAAAAVADVLEPLLAEACAALEEAADQSDTIAALAAAGSLVRLRGDAKRLDQLVRAVSDGPWRDQAVEVLVKLGARAEPALPALEEVARGTHAEGAAAAQGAVRRIRAALRTGPDEPR